jgi:hypothetical protein
MERYLILFPEQPGAEALELTKTRIEAKVYFVDQPIFRALESETLYPARSTRRLFNSHLQRRGSAV